MKIFTWSLVILMTVIFFSNQYLNAHVGTNATIYDGQAGPYPFQIIIRSPDVIPGWTDITVQIKNPEDVDRVTIQIARFNTEKKDAPAAEDMERVVGTDYFQKSILVMARGVYGVYVTVEGAKGKGTDVVPFQALLYTPGQLPLHAKLILLGAAILSTLLFIAIIRAHIIQGFLGLSAAPSNEDYRRGRIGMAVLALCLLGLFTFFFKWWDKEAQQLQKKKYHQLHISTHVEEKNDQRLLFLKIDDPDWNERLGKKLSIPFFEEPEWTDWEWLPLTLDHGKWMHIYMIREPNLDFIAHIHPIKIDESNFEAIIPPTDSSWKICIICRCDSSKRLCRNNGKFLKYSPLRGENNRKSIAKRRS